jgi:hypothetical protein
MSLPNVKQKASAKHTPDLVLDLPEGSNSSPSGEGSEPDSPTSTADTFAEDDIDVTLDDIICSDVLVSGTHFVRACCDFTWNVDNIGFWDMKLVSNSTSCPDCP